MSFIKLTSPRGNQNVVNMAMVSEIIEAKILINGIQTSVSRVLFNFQIDDDIGFTDVLETHSEILDKNR